MLDSIYNVIKITLKSHENKERYKKKHKAPPIM